MLKITGAVLASAALRRTCLSRCPTSRCRWSRPERMSCTLVRPALDDGGRFNNANDNGDVWGATCLSVRRYAKSKDKKSNKAQKKVAIDENFLAEHLKYNVVKTEMEKAVINLKNNYIKNLSLRSSTGALDSLPVTFEGDEYVLQDLAQIVRKNPKTIILNMISFPQAIPAVLDSLKASGMNLNPQQDKTSIFIPIPKVTKEHRENLSKGAKALFVKCKDSIKETQNKQIKLLKDNDKLAKDLVHNLQDQITALADKYVLEAQRIMEEKQSELKGDS